MSSGSSPALGKSNGSPQNSHQRLAQDWRQISMAHRNPCDSPLGRTACTPILGRVPHRRQPHNPPTHPPTNTLSPLLDVQSSGKKKLARVRKVKTSLTWYRVKS